MGAVAEVAHGADSEEPLERGALALEGVHEVGPGAHDLVHGEAGAGEAPFGQLVAVADDSAGLSEAIDVGRSEGDDEAIGCGKVAGGVCEPVVDAAEAFRGGGGGEVAVVKGAVVGVGVVDQLRFGEGLGR